MNRSFSKIKHIQESNSRLEKRLLDEQGFDPKKDYLSKGYIDVTDGFMKDTYVLQIADGDYKCDGSGYSFRIVTNDGKETGYVVIIKSGVRGMITGPVKVVNNGVGLNIGTWGRDFDSLLYNEKLNQVKLVRPLLKENRGLINEGFVSELNKDEAFNVFRNENKGVKGTVMFDPAINQIVFTIGSRKFFITELTPPQQKAQPTDSAPKVSRPTQTTQANPVTPVG